MSISPAFMYHLLNLSEGVFILFLSLGLWYFLEKKHFILATVFAIVLSLSALEYVLVVSLLLLYLLRKSSANISPIFAVIISIVLLKQLLIPTLRFILPGDVLSVLSSFIFEFGNYSGVSMILIGTSIIALFHLFLKKQYYLLGLYVVTILLSIFTQNNFLFNVLIILFSTVIFNLFLQMKWDFNIFKYVSYLIMVLLFVLPLLGFVQSYVAASPDDSDLLRYDRISDLSINKALYLPGRTEQFMYYTAIDSFPRTTAQRLEFSQILYSTEIEFTYELLIENQISHLILTDELVDIFFDDEVKGLLINVNDDTYFEEVYVSENYSIHRVKPIEEPN